jgi:hypothetical protein
MVMMIKNVTPTNNETSPRKEQKVMKMNANGVGHQTISFLSSQALHFKNAAQRITDP